MKYLKTDAVILFLLILGYFILATKDITLPGASFEEVACANGTIDLLLDKESNYIFYIPFLGKQFPLMVSNHLPAIRSYLLIPFFMIFGISVFSLRLASVSFGALTLFFTYLFARQLFDRRIGIIALLFLITSPYFILAIRLEHPYWIFFAFTSLFCLLKWYKNGNLLYFLLATLFLGFGISTSSWFIVFLGGLSITAIIFQREIRTKIKESRIISLWPYVILGFVFFCLGNFLFFYANLIHKPRFVTINWLYNNFRHTGFGIDNLNYINNFASRINNLKELLGQVDLINNITFSNLIPNRFYYFLFIFSISGLICLLFFSKVMYFNKKKIGFLLILMFAILAFSPITVSSFASWHLFVLAPMIYISVVVGLVEINHFFKNSIFKRVSFITMLTLILIPITLNLNTLKNCYTNGKKVVYRDLWSDNIYELVDWLKADKHSKVISINLGFFRNIYFLTEGEIYVEDCLNFFSQEIKKDLAIEWFLNSFKDAGNIYLFNAQTYTQFGKYEKADIPRFETFMKAVKISGKNLIKEKVFYQKDGQPIYIVFTVK
ncbi:MAG: glycosyltransferase family 39 protein [bacterium]|nr:glycosyltransferase family 39 protein [bacterium]